MIAVIWIGALLAMACQDDAGRIASFLERGNAYVEEGDDEEAIIEFKNVLQRDPAPWTLALEVARVLAPGGLLLLETTQVAPSVFGGWRLSATVLRKLQGLAAGGIEELTRIQASDLERIESD